MPITISTIISTRLFQVLTPAPIYAEIFVSTMPVIRWNFCLVLNSLSFQVMLMLIHFG